MNESSEHNEMIFLNIIMNDELRERISEVALEKRKEVSRQLAKQLNKAICAHIRISGFRPNKTHQAAIPQLIKAVSEVIEDKADLLTAVVGVWAEANPELRLAVGDFMDKHQLTSDGPITRTELPIGYWSIDELNEISAQFCENQPEYDPGETKLMICWQSQRIPLTEEIINDIDQDIVKANIDQMHGLLWETWLSTLQELSAEAPEWDSFEVFITEVRRLADQKLEDTTFDRTSLVETLEQLREQAAPMLEYFDLSNNVAEWDAEGCDPTELEHAEAQIAAFQQKLLAYQSLFNTPSANLQEDKDKREQLEIIEKKALSLYESISQDLLSAFDEDTAEASIPKTVMEEDGEGETIPDVDETHEHLTSIEEQEEVAKSIEPLEEMEGLVDEQKEKIIDDEAEQMPEALIEPAISDQDKDTSPAMPDDEIEPSDEIEEHPEAERMDGDAHLPVEDVEDEQAQPTAIVDAKSITAQQAAETLLTSDAQEDMDNFLWSLLYEADLPGAYWLAESLISQGQECKTPAWLLKAVQGSFWLSAESDLFVTDLLDIVNANPQPQDDHVQEMLGLAASLCPTLIAPHSGLIGWLQTPSCCNELKPLVDALQEFASYQIALCPEDVLGVSGADQRKSAIEDAVRAANRWLEDAPTRRTKFKRASDVWWYLTGRKGELRQLVEYVGKDNRNALEKIERKLEYWQDQAKVSDHIDALDQDLYELRARQIVGIPRDQLFRYIDETCQIVQRWYKLVLHEREIETRGNWIFDQIDQLRARVQENLPVIIRALKELATPTQPASLRAVSTIVSLALGSLLETLQIGTDNFEYDPQDLDRWRWLTVDADSLQEALNHRLWLMSALGLSERFFPSKEDLINIPSALRNAYIAGTTIEQAINEWIDKQDFRFGLSLQTALPDIIDTSRLHREYSEALEGSRAALKRNMTETTNAIEQAVVDGIIADKRSEFTAVVEGIEPSEVLNIKEQYTALQEVRNSLNEARRMRLIELVDHWQEVKATLDTSSIENKKKTEIAEVVEIALQKNDTRLVEAYIARLMDIIDSEDKIDQAWQLSPPKRDDLVEFIQSEPKIKAWLESRNNSLSRIAKEIVQGGTNIDINYDEISTKRRGEAQNAILEWRYLKQQRGNNKNHPNRIATVLRYLGFTFLDPNISKQIIVEKSGSDWLYARANMSASELAKPIPQFGTFTQEHYHVICLWERPGADTISARLRELRLKLDSVILLFLGRLTIRQRNELLRMSSEQELALAVLDEVLLLFLTKERDVRLPTFLRCSLPFAAVNPYTPFQAGDVPPEMFFGRESMARELQRPQGSNIVFGGRQLGKSALLRHVEREFHNPTRKQYARVEDIKLLGDPTGGQNTDALWSMIRDVYKEFSLISNRITTDKPEEIERYIREAMREDPELRVLLLFDETDNFLDEDAKEHFRITERLRILMLDTQYRLKVVFAGLHNVQRFQGIANQPLAHFGAPLCVGPLEPDAAYQLVREPLAYLGYRFSDDSGPLRILSYTNYHPGLIQLFCQELINRVRSAPGQNQVPFLIEQKDVEAVYRRVHIRIRERFDWTLALDMRYQAIAWALIEDQMEYKDSYARPYPPGEILGLVRYWWPQGFGEVSTEELRSLLDEMVGLGVLVRDANGHYRLRSPNLVRLMGSEADIDKQLIELSDKQPPTPFDADYHHAPLDERASQYSPFTHAQERSLNKKSFGVGLIFGSDALGWQNIESAIERFVPSEGTPPPGSFFEIPLFILTGDDLDQLLNKHMRIYPDMDHIIAYYKPYPSTPEEIQSVVEGAIEYCKRHQSKRKVLRLLFLFDPDAAWVWHSLPESLRNSLEDSCDVVISPNRWNNVGIRQLLSQHGKIDSDTVCQDVLTATGGWPWLLDKLFDRLGKEDDPRPTVQDILSELEKQDTDLHKDFVSAIGIIERKPVIRVLKHILAFNEIRIPLELITPEMIEGEDQLTESMCDRALAYMDRFGILQHVDDEIEIDSIVKRVLQAK